MSLIEILNRRYATKQFDPTQKLSDDQLFQLTESLRLAPSSFGLQPWKFLVVTNSEIIQQLQQTNHSQQQIATANTIIVLCSKDTINESDISRYIETIANARGMSAESLKGYQDMMVGYIGSKSEEWKRNRNEKQVYIAQGFLLMAAAQLGIDACPMEGFDAQAYDQILGLQGSGYHSVVIVPVGYRSTDDKYALAPKVRHTAEQVIEYIK